MTLLLSGCSADAGEGTATPAGTDPAGTSSPDPAPSPTTTEAAPAPEVSFPSSPTIPEAAPPPPPPAPPPAPAPAPAPAPTDRQELPEQITVTGTVQAGVESSCLLLDGLLLIGGSPDVLRPGNRVRVTGRIDQTMVTFCQQGIPLIVTSAENA